jgi:exo-beta-1,3-glucanase (GH17 family)
MARIRIEDLPPADDLMPEEMEQIFGAGRTPFRPTLEGLETRDLMAAHFHGALLPDLTAGAGPLVSQTGQALPPHQPQVLAMQASYGQQQVANLSGLSVIEALRAASNWIIYEPITSYPGQQVGEAQIRKELQMLYDRGFRGLVTYAFDNGREEIPRIAKEVGFQQVIAGLWAVQDYQVEKANLTPARLQYIDGLVVGNEVRLRNDYSLDELRRRVNEIKALSGKPTTTADAWHLYTPNHEPALMQIGDWVFPNLHPFYERGWSEAHMSPEKGFEFLSNVLRDHFSAAKTGAKLVALHESWWPSAQDGAIGDPTYRGSGTPAHQKRYFELLAQSGVVFVYGEAFDQSWKGNEGDVPAMGRFGTHWGLWHDTSTAKDVVSAIQTGYRPGYRP